MKHLPTHTVILQKIASIALLIFGITATYSHCSSLVPAVLIHNQQQGITDSLKPFLASGVTEFLLCGDATDGTIDIAKNFLESAGAQITIDNTLLDNDGAYYTHICSTVKTLFPRAEFCLLFNGQWLIHNVNSILGFCQNKQDEQCPVYWIKLSTHGVDEDNYKPVLVRCNQNVTFEGIINPSPKVQDVEKGPADVYFEWNKILWGISNAKKLFTDDRDRLLRAYSTNSGDAHLIFNLATIYESLNDLKNAYHFYTLRNSMKADPEEDYLTTYKLALLLNKITEGKDNWQLQYHYLAKAHEMRPWRAEPLVKIAQHYLHEGNNHLAFLFSRQASLINYPHQDAQSIECHAYDYSPFDILGITSWYVDEFEVGEQALRRALKTQPWNGHLSQNLDFYVKRRESQTALGHKKDARIPAGFGVNFHDSMKHGFKYNYETIETDPFLHKVKTVYEKYTITDVEYRDTPRIPKIIHQIWLGSALPDKYKAWQATWFVHHSDWQYILWTQKEIDELGLKNRAQFDAALTYGEKSDIARYEILYKFGGVYADADFECMQPMDVFHHCCDFYAGLEGTTAVIGNSIIGSAPGHPILRRCIDTLHGAVKGEEGWQYVVDRTGPGHVTTCVKAEIMGDDQPKSRIVIFPACYFFPWYPIRPEPRPIEGVIKSLRPETFALHLWESSWVK